MNRTLTSSQRVHGRDSCFVVRRNSPRRWLVPSLVVGTVAVVAACGNSGGVASAPSSSASSSSSSGAAGSVLGTMDTKIGTVLVNEKQATVYEFANDHGSTSTCTGSCASVWPPVAAPDTLPGSLPGVTGQLGTTTRDDGSKQLTVAGHPVYTFTGDSAPGQTNGNGIVLNGGLWTAVSPSGAPASAGSSTPPASSSPTY
jgi:predicted lipoprotein with Yx(FWY)xxD motif